MSFRNSAPQLSGFPIAKIVIYGIAALVVLCTLLGTTYVVDQGRYGVVKRFGQIVDVTSPGLHVKWPFVDDVEEIPSALQTLQVNATSVSKDIQEVQTKVNVQYSIPASVVKDIYINYRGDRTLLDQAIVGPGTEAVTKSVTARFTAEQLISQREQVASELKDRLATHLKKNAGLILAKIDITDFGFSPSFTKAIEDKVVAEQAVLTEQQNLARQQVSAQQAVATAKAEAEATRLRADAEAYAIKRQNENANELTVRLREADAKIKMAEAEGVKAAKWSPTVIGGGTPLIQMTPEK